MTTTGSMVTSSGEFGPPEGGVSQGIVPALCTSSSHDGLSTWCDAGRVDEFATANYNTEFPPLLRLRGGGRSLEEREEDKSAKAGPLSPVVVLTRVRAGPRCPKERGTNGIGKGMIRKERDWSKGRKILSSEEDEDTEERNKGEKEDEDYMPHSPAEIIEFSRMAREGAKRKLRSMEEALTFTKPTIVSVTTLEGRDRVRLASPGVKRGREEKEERTDVEGENEEGEEEDSGSGLSSRDSSASRLKEPSLSDRQKAPKAKRRKGGHQAVTLGHEWQFPAAKIKARAKEREREIIEEKEVEILDPETKATSARAKSVERKAMVLVDKLRETSTP